MKKKMIILLLTLGILGTAMGCGEKKDKAENKEGTKTEQSAQEDFQLTNKNGKVVAADVDKIEDYITLGEYKNLQVTEAPKAAVTDEEVENSITYKLTTQYKAEVTEDRAVQQDDIVNIDFTGYMDGEEFDGGSAQGEDLHIGSGSMIEGFEDGLVGHKKGEEVTLDLTFPVDYKATELQGKAVQFKVKINSISVKPELTDEWAAANTDYKTVEEFKTAEKEAMQKSVDLEYEGQVKSDLFSMVVEATEFKEYPEALLEQGKKDVRERLDQMYQAQFQMTLDDYVKQQGISDEDVEKVLTESAQTYLQQNLIVQAIFNAEGIEMSEEDYTAEEAKFSELNGFPDVETMKMYYGDLNVLKDSVLWNKACDVIMETATVTEQEPEADTQAVQE